MSKTVYEQVCADLSEAVAKIREIEHVTGVSRTISRETTYAHLPGTFGAVVPSGSINILVMVEVSKDAPDAYKICSDLIATLGDNYPRYKFVVQLDGVYD